MNTFVDEDKNVASVLTMEHFVFDSISFERKGFRSKQSEIPSNISVHIVKQGDGEYVVTLTVSADKSDEYEASVTISGYCKIEENTPQKDLILNVNAPAILFPYARAELTLLTAQPETDPLVLPVVNFQQLYENSKKDSTDIH